MKRKSLKFLSVFLSVSMVLTPVSSTFAESMDLTMEQTVTETNEAVPTVTVAPETAEITEAAPETPVVEPTQEATEAPDAEPSPEVTETPAEDETAGESTSEVPTVEPTPEVTETPDAEPIPEVTEIPTENEVLGKTEEGTPEAAETPEVQPTQDAKPAPEVQPTPDAEPTPEVTEPQEEEEILESEETLIEETNAEEEEIPEFKVDDAIVLAGEDHLDVVLFTSNTHYNKIYIGKKEDETRKPEYKGIELEEGGYYFEVELPLEMQEQEIFIVPYNQEKEEWYVEKDIKYVLPKAEEIVSEEVLAVSEEVIEEEKDEELEYTDGSYNISISSDFSMFKITSQSAKVENGKLVVTIETSKNTYDKIYLGSKNDEQNYEGYIQGVKKEEEDGYTFTFSVAKSKMGQTIDFVPGKSDGTWYGKNQYHLTIPTVLDYAEGEYNVSVSSDFPMFKITSQSAYVEGGKIIVTIATSKNTYDKIYLGSKNEEQNYEGYIQGVKKEKEDGYTFTFEVTSAMRGQTIDFVPGKSDGTWYSKNQYHLTIPTVLDYSDGDYDIAIESTFSMFKITSQSAVISGGNIMVTLETSKNTYDKIYLGSKNEEQNYEGYIQGVKKEKEDGYIFKFTLDKALMGKSIDFVPGKSDGTWYSKNQYQLTIPRALSKVEKNDLGYETGDYTIAIESDNSEFVITKSSANVYRGKLTVTISTAKDTYNKIYLGALKDVETADAASIITGIANGEGGYTFALTFSKEDFGALIKFVPGNAEGWLNKQCTFIVPTSLGKAYTSDDIANADPMYENLHTINYFYDYEDRYEVVLVTRYANPFFNRVEFGICNNDTSDFEAKWIAYRYDLPDGQAVFRTTIYKKDLPESFTYLERRAVRIDGTDNGVSFQTLSTGTAVPTYKNGIYDAPQAGVYLVNGTENIRTAFNVLYTEVKIQGEEATITLKTNTAVYDMLYINTANTRNVMYVPCVNAGTPEDAPYHYTFTIPVSMLGSVFYVSPGNAEENAYSERQWVLSLPYSLDYVSEIEDDSEGGSEDVTIKDGEYTVEAETDAAMFKIVSTVLTNKSGVMTAKITMSGTGTDRLYMGSAEEAAKADESQLLAPIEETEGKYVFEIPVSALDTPIALASRGTKSGTWFDRKVTFKSDTLVKVEEKLADGTYSAAVTTGESMFKVVNAVLTNKNGVMTAKVTLSGTGYDYLYMGTGDAAVADNAGWIGYTVEASGEFAGKYTFEIPVSALDTPIAVAAHSVRNGTWYDRKMTFDSSSLKLLGGSETTPTPEATPTPEVTPTPEATPTPEITPIPEVPGKVESEHVKDTENATSAVDNTTTVPDGSYQPDRFEWSGGSGKTKISCLKVTIAKGKAYATIQFSSDAFPQLKANGNIYTGICANGTSTYSIPVTLGKNNTVIGYSAKMNAWITYTVNPVVTENSKEPSATPTPMPMPSATPTPKPDEKPSKPVKPGEQGNGDYSITVDSNAIMFKVVNCVLTVKDGTYTADITLSGTGYDYLFIGTAAQAAAADKADYIGYTVNENGQYVYTIPVAALDKPIAVAAHAIKSGEWYDRELTFDSSTMVLLKGDEPTVTPSPTPTPNPEEDTKADEESKYETDLSGGTSAVDSSTGLADGVYTPDKFSWSGGSGRTNITCSKVTVTGGQAYATIVFGSTSYGYVKANGNVYYPSYGAGTSSFTIPVKLNANNTIIGMTTAMSAAHEITYTIYIYIAGADASSSDASGEKLDNNSLSEKAPEIIGLDYVKEAEIEYAEYFKMYYYKDGITLIEVDMSTNTDRPEEDIKDEEETAEAAEKTASAEESSEESEEVKDNITAIAELYQNKVIRYLLVPEGVEIPVGLDKEMIVVNLPVESVYTDSKEAKELMKQLELEELLTLEGETAEKPEYKEMILKKTDFAILSDEFLWDEEKEDLTLEEQSELFYEITERLTTLGIPAIVDRSADEESEEAAAEWIKVYNAIFECEDK